jgi:hypothetical protein
MPALGEGDIAWNPFPLPEHQVRQNPDRWIAGADIISNGPFIPKKVVPGSASFCCGPLGIRGGVRKRAKHRRRAAERSTRISGELAG